MNILSKMTVIDFTQTYSGPFCTMQLADFGAMVVKIESKEHGDAARAWEPMSHGQSGYYATMNRNKYSVAVDLKTSQGIELVKSLIAKADVVIENFKPGTMEHMGLGYETLKALNPQIIYASISGFGQSGPLCEQAAYDNVLQAMSGLTFMTGFPEGDPVRVGPSVSDSLSALHMALALSMAYYHKLQTGEGQCIDVSMLDSLFSVLENPVLQYSLNGVELGRTGNNDRSTLAPYDVYPCKDGYFSAGLAGEAGWDRFCNVLGMPELIDDPLFANNDQRCQNYELLTEKITPFFLQHDRKTLGKLFTEALIPCAPVLGVPELMQHPQIQAREMLVTLDTPGLGDCSYAANPVKLDKCPPTYRCGAPELGQDTDFVLQHFGYSKDNIAEMRAKGFIV